jgi:hypothetical protein
MTALARSTGSLSQVAGPEPSEQRRAAADCSPRPTLDADVRRFGADGLQVTVVAQGRNNSLRALRFGGTSRQFQNAVVSLPGHPVPITGDFAQVLPPDAAQRSFVVRRVMSGRDLKASISVTDACGEWLLTVRGDGDKGLRLESRRADD